VSETETAKVNEIDRPIESLGTLTFAHADNLIPDCECDRVCYANSTLMAASFVATSNQIKAVRAILHAKRGKVSIRCTGITCQYPSKTNDLAYRRFADPLLEACEKGYNLWVHKMDYGKMHATVISKDKNLIMYVSPESVWSRLQDSELYETPMIREWMPYITQQLIRHQYLRECRCYRTNSAILDIKKVEQLDEIVTDGLKSGKIMIP
jgi:hypothetical protein